MKLNLRHAVWTLALSFTVTMLSAPSVAAAYQSEQGLEHGRGDDKNSSNAYANNPNYQQGVNHGQDDRANNRARRYRVSPNNDLDRRAYQSGYDQGYQNYRGGGINPDGSPAGATYIPNAAQGGWTAPVTPQQISPLGPQNRPYAPNGNRPYGNNVQNVAYKNGFQEGLRYGQSDRNNGHSNRPTYSSTYKQGTNGFNSSYGSQTAYKNAFQEGFRTGYAQGYNSGYRR